MIVVSGLAGHRRSHAFEMGGRRDPHCGLCRRGSRGCGGAAAGVADPARAAVRERARARLEVDHHAEPAAQPASPRARPYDRRAQGRYSRRRRCEGTDQDEDELGVWQGVLARRRSGRRAARRLEQGQGPDGGHRRRDAEVRIAAVSLFAFALAAAGISAQRAPSVLAAAAPTSYNVTEKSIDELQRAMTAGEVTSRRLVDLYVARIDAYDKQGPALNAIVAIN